MTRAMKRRNRRKARRMYLGGSYNQQAIRAADRGQLYSRPTALSERAIEDPVLTLADFLPEEPIYVVSAVDPTRRTVTYNTHGVLTQEMVERAAQAAMLRGGRP